MAENKDKKSKDARGRKKLAFFAGLVAELKRVAWPDRQKLLQSTAAVVIVAVSFALLIWVVDTTLGAGMNLLGYHEPKKVEVQDKLPEPMASEQVPVVPAESSVGG